MISPMVGRISSENELWVRFPYQNLKRKDYLGLSWKGLNTLLFGEQSAIEARKADIV